MKPCLSFLSRCNATTRVLTRGIYTFAPEFSTCNGMASHFKNGVHERNLAFATRHLHISSRLYTPSVKTMNVPSLGDSITEGTLSEWKVAVGDTVEVDQAVATVETDKVNVDVNASHSGKIVKLHANEGDVILVGKPLVDIESSG